MDERLVRKTLSGLPLGGLKYFNQTGSTNDVALAWAASDALDFSLVVADEQTSGRGRMQRKWFTPPGSALAFSLVLRPSTLERPEISLFAGLGALALVRALQARSLQAQIKWPNDVLVGGRKLAGVLVESVWTGEEVDSLVLGMGINVLKGSVPPGELLQFPATCIESETGHIERVDLLKEVLNNIIRLRTQISSPEFIKTWEGALAFRDKQVQVWEGNDPPLTGVVRGLGEDGALRLETATGVQSIQFGEIHLRPL